MNKYKDICIKIGMGSCGIAVGANDIFQVFIKEFKRRHMDGIIKKVGCIGNCYAEPLVEVMVKGMPNIMYGKVDKKFVYKIIDDHILNKKILVDHIFEFNYENALEEK